MISVPGDPAMLWAFTVLRRPRVRRFSSSVISCRARQKGLTIPSLPRPAIFRYTSFTCTTDPLAPSEVQAALGAGDDAAAVLRLGRHGGHGGVQVAAMHVDGDDGGGVRVDRWGPPGAP